MALKIVGSRGENKGFFPFFFFFFFDRQQEHALKAPKRRGGVLCIQAAYTEKSQNTPHTKMVHTNKAKQS